MLIIGNVLKFKTIGKEDIIIKKISFHTFLEIICMMRNHRCLVIVINLCPMKNI